MISVTLVHHTTRETITLETEQISPNGVFVTMRWGQSGLYDLNVITNVLKARSIAARRKNKKLGVPWEAEDIDKVREDVSKYVAMKQGRPLSLVEEEFNRHIASMPGAVGPKVNSAKKRAILGLLPKR